MLCGKGNHEMASAMSNFAKIGRAAEASPMQCGKISKHHDYCLLKSSAHESNGLSKKLLVHVSSTDSSLCACGFTESYAFIIV